MACLVADSADVFMQGLHHVASARGGEGGGGWSALEVAVIPAADAAGGGGVSDTLAALAGVVPPGSDYYPRIIDADDFVTSEREKRRTPILEIDGTVTDIDAPAANKLPSESIRPRGQYGLEEF